MRIISHFYDENCSDELVNEINHFCDDLSRNCVSIKSLNCLRNSSVQKKIERLDQKIDAYKKRQLSVKSHTIINSDQPISLNNDWTSDREEAMLKTVNSNYEKHRENYDFDV